MKKHWKLLLTLALATALALALGVSAGAADLTLEVNPSGSYTTIRSALGYAEHEAKDYGHLYDNIIIKLLADSSEAVNISEDGKKTYETLIDNNQNITIDLNDHVFSGSICFDGGGVDAYCPNITIIDSSVTKTTRYYTKAEDTGVWVLALDQTTATDYSTVGGAIVGSTVGEQGVITLRTNNIGSLTLKDITVAGNCGNSGVVCAIGPDSVLVENCTFVDNSAVTGAAICVLTDGATGSMKCTVSNCDFTDNHSTGVDNLGGAAVCFNGNSLKVKDNKLEFIGKCTFSGNSALGEGGAIHAQYTNISLINAESVPALFENNSSDKNGSAIYACNSTLTISGYNFTKNSGAGSGSYGSVIYFVDVDGENKLSISGDGETTGIFSQNAIKCVEMIGSYSYETIAELSGLQFLNNTMLSNNYDVNYGNYINYAVSASNINAKITDTDFGGNKYNGAVLFADNCDEVELTNVTFTDNAGILTGGLFCRNSKTTLNKCIISGNTGVGAGAGIISYSAIVLNNTTVRDNKCDIHADIKADMKQKLNYTESQADSDYWAKATQIAKSYMSKTNCGIGGILLTTNCELTLSGKVVITDNSASEYGITNYAMPEKSDLVFYLPTNDSNELIPNGGNSSVPPFITDESSLDPGSNIGVTALQKAGSPVGAHEKPENLSEYYLSEPTAGDISEYVYSNSGYYHIGYTEIQTKYMLTLIPAKEYLKATMNGARYNADDDYYYAFNGDVFSVDITVEGENFAGAEYYVEYDPAVLQLMSYDSATKTYTALEPDTTSGVKALGAQEALPEGIQTREIVTIYGTEYVRLNANAVLAEKDKAGVTNGQLPAGTKIGTLYFKAKADKINITNGTVNLGGKIALTAADAAAPVDANGCLTSGNELVVAPLFDIELVSDYVSGKTLAVLYTESTAVRFALDKSFLIGVEDNDTVKYTYGRTDEQLTALAEADRQYLNSGAATNAQTYVYAIVADVAADDWSISKIYDRMSFDITGKTSGTYPNAISFKDTAQYNVNGSTKIDLYDAVAAAGVYNVIEEMFATADNMSTYMSVILKSDVNRDGIVDMLDVTKILSNYTR